MTQSVPTAGTRLPFVARRSPLGGYRVTQPTSSATSYATKRVLGMWVPAEAFRAGTIVKVSGATSTASPIIRLSVGGNGATANAGVSYAWTTGPAAACGFVLTLTQRADGHQPGFDASGFFSGATSLVVSSSAYTSAIQPLNYVEVNTGGTFALWGMVLEVIPPVWAYSPYQHRLDV